MAMSLSAALARTVNMGSSSPLNPSTEFSHFSSLRLRPTIPTLKSNSRPRMLTLVQVKKQTFSSLDELLEKSDKPVLVDFYATWCGPCQFMVPILEQVSSLMQDKIQIVKIDTEENPSIADKYRIEALPTFILFKDGKQCDRFEGALAAAKLIERIETSLNVD